METTTLSNGLTYDSRAYNALMDMLNACKAEGLEPIVCSAYRSVERQTELFQNKIDSYMADGLSYDEAYAATAVEIAVPGTSEHSLAWRPTSVPCPIKFWTTVRRIRRSSSG